MNNEELVRKYQQGDESALAQLLESNTALVRKIALRWINSNYPLDDAIQNGFMGMIQAADRFELERNLKFSTYAYFWITKEVRDGVPGYDWRHRTVQRLMRENPEMTLEQIYDEAKKAVKGSNSMAWHTFLELAKGKTYISIDKEVENENGVSSYDFLEAKPDNSWEVNYEIEKAIRFKPKNVKRLVGLLKEGKSIAEAAQEMECSTSMLYMMFQDAFGVRYHSGKKSVKKVNNLIEK